MKRSPDSSGEIMNNHRAVRSKGLCWHVAVAVVLFASFGFHLAHAETATNPKEERVRRASMGRMVTAGNEFYQVHVEESRGSGMGIYTATTGSRHPSGEGLNVLFGDGFPSTTFNTIRSYTTGTDYVQDSGKDSFFQTVWLDPYAVITPIGTTGYRTTYTLPGSSSTPDKLKIISDVNVNGATYETSSIEVTTMVINNGTSPVKIGVRYLWDYQIGYDDGPTFQQLGPDGQIKTRELQFDPPGFVNYRILDNDGNPEPPTFGVLGTADGPSSVTPSPTLPSRLQYTCWPSSFDTAFDYTIDPNRDVATLASPCSFDGGDSAVLYLFGHDEAHAIIIPAGGTNTVSASIFLRPPPPAVPSDLRAEAVSQSEIQLTWKDNSNNEIGFKIERAPTEEGPWQEIDTVQPNTTAYSDDGLQIFTTYFYRIRAYNNVGDSAYTDTVNATTWDFPPVGPSNLVAAAVTGYQVQLTWNDETGNEAGFRIERALNPGGPWTNVGQVGANIENFIDSTVEPLTAYSYRAVAFNSGGVSPYSNVASVTTPNAPPRPPTFLIGTTISSSRIDLTWTDNSNTETAFLIERAPAFYGPWVQVGTTGANVTSYSDEGLNFATTYHYRVRAYNQEGYSAYSNPVSAATFYGLPSAPVNLVASADTSNLEVVLSWTDTANNEFSFNIERSIVSADGPYFLVGNVSANASTFENHNLLPCSTYYYRVRAYNTDGYSAYSNVAIATTTGCLPVPPSGPAALSAQAISDSTIILGWVDIDNQEDGFKIRRATSPSGPWTVIATAGRNTSGYTDTTAKPQTTYYYKVRAFNEFGQSPWVGPVSAKTANDGAPVAPSDLTATEVSGPKVSLSWDDNSDNEILFKIFRRKPGQAWEMIGYVLTDTTTYTDASVFVGATYEYKVKAVSPEGNSPTSNIADVTITGGVAATDAGPFPVGSWEIQVGATAESVLCLTFTDDGAVTGRANWAQQEVGVAVVSGEWNSPDNGSVVAILFAEDANNQLVEGGVISITLTPDRVMTGTMDTDTSSLELQGNLIPVPCELTE
jgi:hypothetical protein